jgi:hypothetical protein
MAIFGSSASMPSFFHVRVSIHDAAAILQPGTNDFANDLA